MGDWKSVKAENLVCHGKSGIYYLRAKVGGKIIRKSLGTRKLRIAKMKRDDLLPKLRARAGAWKKGETITSLKDAIGLVTAWYSTVPSYQEKPGSLKYRNQCIAVLERTLPNRAPSSWTNEEIKAWWHSKDITAYSAGRRNNILGTLRKMFEILIEQGACLDDPTKGFKKIPVRTKEVPLPTKAEFHQVIESIKTQNRRASVEASQFVEFMAYSGLRPGETSKVAPEDIEKDWILITGDESGTKNHELRRVPITPPMRDLLERMSYSEDDDTIFSISPPRGALNGACERLEIERFTPKTFRHLFATTCLESGIDFATVAGWIGHKDGGALLAKVYSHLRDEHSLSQAAKVEF